MAHNNRKKEGQLRSGNAKRFIVMKDRAAEMAKENREWTKKKGWFKLQTQSVPLMVPASLGRSTAGHTCCKTPLTSLQVHLWRQREGLWANTQKAKLYVQSFFLRTRNLTWHTSLVNMYSSLPFTNLFDRSVYFNFPNGLWILTSLKPFPNWQNE